MELINAAWEEMGVFMVHSPDRRNIYRMLTLVTFSISVKDTSWWSVLSPRFSIYQEHMLAVMKLYRIV